MSWRMTVLRAGLKRVELHVQRRRKPTLDPMADQQPCDVMEGLWVDGGW